MRILVCASELPVPPLNGLRLQLANVIEPLAERHEIVVVGFRWPDQGTHVAAPVEVNWLPGPRASGGARARGWLQAGVRREPIEAIKLGPRLSRAVRHVVAARRFDVAHVINGEIAGVSDALGDTPSLIAPLDAWHLNVAAEVAVTTGLRRVVRKEQARRVRTFVRTAYRPYRRVVLVSEADAAATLALAPDLPVAVVPNGVDAAFYGPDPSAGVERETIVFTGAMGFAPNVRAAEVLVREVLPRVRERHPDARVNLVGRDPAPAVQALASERVHVTGEVPDVRPWIHRGEVYVCPMTTGTGIKNKLLEALACGAACVTTPLGAQGVRIHDGEHALVAGDPGELAAAVSRVMAEPGLREHLSAAGRRLVERDHTWEAVARSYEALYEEIADGRGR